MNSANSHTCEQWRYDTGASFRLALGRPKLRPLRGLVRRPAFLERCGPVPPAAAGRTAFAHRRDVYDFALPTSLVQSGGVLCRLYLNVGTLALALWLSLFQSATPFK